jgi:ABC-type transporter Mla maintaining outer membrane lipid asymmetry permease subunit MlaE
MTKIWSLTNICSCMAVSFEMFNIFNISFEMFNIVDTKYTILVQLIKTWIFAIILIIWCVTYMYLQKRDPTTICKKSLTVVKSHIYLNKYKLYWRKFKKYNKSLLN